MLLVQVPFYGRVTVTGTVVSTRAEEGRDHPRHWGRSSTEPRQKERKPILSVVPTDSGLICHKDRREEVRPTPIVIKS